MYSDVKKSCNEYRNLCQTYWKTKDRSISRNFIIPKIRKYIYIFARTGNLQTAIKAQTSVQTKSNSTAKKKFRTF